jgi:hypothetical protein
MPLCICFSGESYLEGRSGSKAYEVEKTTDKENNNNTRYNVFMVIELLLKYNTFSKNMALPIRSNVINEMSKLRSSHIVLKKVKPFQKESLEKKGIKVIESDFDPVIRYVCEQK